MAVGDVLGLWIVEALTSLFRCSSALQQAEFSLPFFRAFVAVALRFRGHQNLNLHMRILQGRLRKAIVIGPRHRAMPYRHP